MSEAKENASTQVNKPNKPQQAWLMIQSLAQRLSAKVNKPNTLQQGIMARGISKRTKQGGSKNGGKGKKLGGNGGN